MTDPTPDARSETDRNKRVVQDFFDAFNSGDVDACLALCATPYAWHLYDDPGGAVTLGLDEFRASLTAFRRSIPDCSIEILELVADGDIVAVRAREIGHHTGTPWLGKDATGSFAEWFPFMFYQLRNGRLVAEWSAPISWDLPARIGDLERSRRRT